MVFWLSHAGYCHFYFMAFFKNEAGLCLLVLGFFEVAQFT